MRKSDHDGEILSSGGLGMGLSICRSIIEASGGRLWVTAYQPRGAVFHFTVPAHRDAS
jgi:signal transduction histidine kinase